MNRHGHSRKLESRRIKVYHTCHSEANNSSAHNRRRDSNLLIYLRNTETSQIELSKHHTFAY